MKNKIVVEPNRFDVDVKKGLNKEQVDIRNKQGLNNVTRKKSGKSYFSIFMGNIFTFFNLLGIIIMILMLAVGSWSNMFFFIVILSNTVIGIFQEIRAKLSIEKLQLMAAPTSVVVREGEQKEVDVKDIVLDDVIIFDLGKQITTDSVVLEGEVETNEAILTGESVPVKKKKGDMLLSGSFVVSGKCYAKAERVGNSNYIETLSSKAKQYKGI
jgi:cation-transporting ATPase E